MRLLFFGFIFALGFSSAFGVELVGAPTIESTANQAVVHWVTDVAAGTRVQVSPAATIQTDKTPATQHTATLTGLQPGVTYTVVVGSARVHLATNVFTVVGMVPASARIESSKASATKTISLANITAETKPAPPPRKIWANPESLPDHFARHGGDFQAKDADDYARMSWEFLQRAKAEGLPAKVDEEGVLRVFDPSSGTFASYNRNGTTKTFFKPGRRGYFDRQPGRDVNLKTWK
jgi:pyocin large subunit-like protein